MLRKRVVEDINEKNVLKALQKMRREKSGLNGIGVRFLKKKK